MPSAVNPAQGVRSAKPIVKSPPQKPPPARRGKTARPNIKVKNRSAIPKSQKINIIA